MPALRSGARIARPGASRVDGASGTRACARATRADVSSRRRADGAGPSSSSRALTIDSVDSDEEVGGESSKLVVQSDEEEDELEDEEEDAAAAAARRRWAQATPTPSSSRPTRSRRQLQPDSKSKAMARSNGRTRPSHKAGRQAPVKLVIDLTTASDEGPKKRMRGGKRRNAIASSEVESASTDDQRTKRKKARRRTRREEEEIRNRSGRTAARQAKGKLKVAPALRFLADDEEDSDFEEESSPATSERSSGTRSRGKEALRDFVVSDSDSGSEDDETEETSSTPPRQTRSMRRSGKVASSALKTRSGRDKRRGPPAKTKSGRGLGLPRKRTPHHRLASSSESDTSEDVSPTSEWDEGPRRPRKRAIGRKAKATDGAISTGRPRKLPHLFMDLPALDKDDRDKFVPMLGIPDVPKERISEFLARRTHRTSAKYGFESDQEDGEKSEDTVPHSGGEQGGRQRRRLRGSSILTGDEDLTSDDERANAVEPKDKHWDSCACGRKPSHLILRKLLRRREALSQRDRRSRRRYADDLSPFEKNEEKILEMEEAGGWLECSSCSASLHWACLAPSRQRRILANINVEEQARCRALNKEEEYQQVEGFEATEMLTTIECDNCFHPWGWRCIICNSDRDANPQNQVGLLFRCKRCLRACHYECLQQVEGDDTLNEAALARQTSEWKCLDCESWSDVEQIIAWRLCETPNVAPESAIVPGQPTPIYTASNDLPREYLVKFKHQSYRETQWVPHRWLKIVSASVLSRFLRYGSGVELEVGHCSSSQSALAGPPRKRINFVTDNMGEVEAGPPAPAPDAQERIPSSWKTPERILDVFFRASSVEGLSDPAPRPQKRRVYHTHQQQIADELKSNTNLVHVDDVDEDLLSPDDAEERIDWVAKCLIKWQDVDYQKSTWENVPDDDDPDFLVAFRIFLQGRQVELPEFEPRSKRIKYQELYEQPAYVAGGELLDFQLEGLNWLRYGWMTDQPKILADEMGLGKTIQIISFIGSLHHEFNRGPILIVVPNSTLPNWVRELEKWLPSLRVVPFWGGKDSRAVVEQYELFHSKEQEGRQPLKAHVVITSDSTARLSLDVLDRVPTWEALIVDEGQSLKAGDGGLLYQKLASLDTVYRLIMTGTPLNNNIGELFHLLKFLKPGDEWDAIGKLRRKYEILTPELVDELQPKLKPFFLRRLKQQVANLPPKIEIFVPVSLKPVQKRIYKSLIESNVKNIQALIASKGSKARRKKAVTSLNNILMQLRKCIQHPYLVAPDLGEFDLDEGVQEVQEHERLILASAKMTLLRQMLPKLKARGHRVLIFSQFVIHLELVEAFVQGEGYSYLRLDGEVGQRQRQRGIDAFNAPGSDIFLYLLSTRAGGVGINLAAADTVIMLDPDFNPHVDMQAISRAHRIGQTKRVLVFRLLAKMTAEQRIIEMARKKLVLDHLIVQNLDNVSSSRAEEMEDILRYGAKALFDQDGTEENERDIKYNDEEVEALINRAETEEVDREDEETSDPLGALALPSVFEQPVVTEDDNAEQQTAAEERLDIGDADFWEELLANSAKQNEHSTSEMTLEGQTGRGKRVRRPVKYFQASMGPDRDDDVTVTRKRKKKGRQQGGGSESEDASFDEAQLRRSESPDDLEGQVVNDRNALTEGRFKRTKYPRPPDTPVRIKIPQRTEETHEAFAVLTRLPPSILRDVLDATGPVPEPTAPAERPQLTNAHCVFFHKALNYPMILFAHAFKLVESRHLPAQVIDLPDEGARLLNKQVVASHLFNAARRALAAWKKVAGHYAQDLEAPSYHRQHLNELRVLLMTTDSGRQLSHQEAEQFCEHVRQMAVPDLDMLAAAAVRIPSAAAQHRALQRIFWRVENEFSKQRALLSLQIPKVSMADRLRAIAGTSTSPFARGNVKVSFTDFTVRNEVRKTATQIINANEKGVTRPDARSTDGTSAEASPGRYRVQIDENAYKRRKPGRPPGSGKGATSKRAEMSAQERALAAAGLLPDGNIRETPTPGLSTSAVASTSASAVAVPRPRPTPVRQSAPESRGPVAVVTESAPAQPRATGTTPMNVRPANFSVPRSNGQPGTSTDTQPPSTSNSAAHKRDEKCFICEKSPYHYISKCPFLLDPPAARDRFNHLLDTVVLDRSRTKEERQGMRRLLIFLKYALDKREEGEGLKEMVSQEEIV